MKGKNMLNIIVHSIFVSVCLLSGWFIAMFLEKYVWPNFNKKHKLGEFEEKEKQNNTTKNI